MNWDTFFYNAIRKPLGRGLFENISDEDTSPPPPIGSGYRIATDSVVRKLTDGSFRVTTIFNLRKNYVKK